MLKTRFALAAVALYSGIFVEQSIASPLTSAEVTKIINRVSVIEPAKADRPAALRDVIKDDLGLQTGARSRSELLFQDNTLTRLGAETFFSFKTGTRDMTLEKGSMLLQVPKGLGGAKIHTAAVTAAITGTTIMMEYSPGKYLKVLVLEGSLRLSRNGSFGDSVVLHPGKMVIMRPGKLSRQQYFAQHVAYSGGDQRPGQGVDKRNPCSDKFDHGSRNQRGFSFKGSAEQNHGLTRRLSHE